MRSLLLFSGLITLIVLFAPGHAQALPDSPPVRRCLTLEHAHMGHSHANGSGYLAARTQQTGNLAGRVLLTENIAVHYTLAPNPHRARWTSHDASLRAMVDSVLMALPPSLSVYRRDSTLHAMLDDMGAGHPRYIEKAAEYLEFAWAHYDSIGMKMPGYDTWSRTYVTISDGRFVVDIADVNLVMGVSGMNYGRSWPPALSGSLLIENDFLHAASYNAATDEVTGSPIQVTIAGEPRNYNLEWEMGLKVTLVHELFHAVQFSYVPVLSSNIHAWYELSAIGMEDRLAPEARDYLQFLPRNVPSSHTTSLYIGPGSFANYGNGIFHMFLTHTLGPTFDPSVWEELEANGNNLPSALSTAFGSQDVWDSLFVAYAAAMSLSGTPAAQTSPLAFNPDMHLWPRPHIDTLATQGQHQLDLAPGTYRIVAAPGTNRLLADIPGLPGAWSVSTSGQDAVFLSGGAVPFQNTASRVLVFGNPAFTGGPTRVATLSGIPEGLIAVPNPVSRGEARLLFVPPEGTPSFPSPSDSLFIVSESGRDVARLAPDSTGAGWTWNLEDLPGRKAAPGRYLYRAGGHAARPLLVVP